MQAAFHVHAQRFLCHFSCWFGCMNPAKQMPSFQGQLVRGNLASKGQVLKPNEAEVRLQATRNRGFSRITCQLRSCQSTPVLYKYQEWGDGSRDPTPIASRSSIEGKGTHYPSPHFQFLLLFPKFISIVSPFLLFFPFSYHLSNSESPKKEPKCLPPPAQTANLPRGVPKKPQLQTYLCLRN
jgi:hypothetical protein